ncbi:contact-dependent growth inhibition system immunity protein [Kitasatospora purpeofusca]|uniref:contact-dependent growth inhibition system immunity protein n=1 Tax=Kitasatospora purpeofusca TaxID=67352 RepID=UPI002254760A|nr:contact-dependent growth inhibition system immunity protein [Kitasatospora purpeofusca]MCX4682999.1 contact-dependent growth inhibition system immunity protein [Kitasatospora purpeofusca]
MTRPVNRDRSLEELEHDCWPAPSGDETRLVATVLELRRKPVGDLTVEDLRLLIGQSVGLVHLLPLAVDILRGDPLAEGDMYEGDLLAAVLSRGAEVWHRIPGLGEEVRSIVLELTDVPWPLAPRIEEFMAR